MEIDIELLITLVEARPVLWDKKDIPEYRDKNETTKAWREVCVLLKNNFEEIGDKEKNAFGKSVLNSILFSSLHKWLHSSIHSCGDGLAPCHAIMEYCVNG